MRDVLKSAMELHQSGQLLRAAALYQKVLAADPENAEAMHLLGVVHHQQGENEKAIELVSRSVALRPSAPGFHANLAEVYRALGQYERAVGCCRAALALKPDYPEALGNLGLSLSKLGKHDEAVAALRKAIELNPRLPVVHNNLGNVLRELGRLDEAIIHARRSIELDPSYAPPRTNLGQMLLDAKRPEEALPHCQEAVRLQPYSAVMHHNLGNVYRDLRRYVEARAAYMEAIRLDPRMAQAHAQLGVTLVRENQLDEALSWLRKAAELDPNDDRILEALGELLLEREEFAEAADVLKQALALSSPKRAVTHLVLGWSLQEDGRGEEALAHYEAAGELWPRSAIVQNYLGGYYEEQGRLREAEAAYRRAIEYQPSFSLPYARLGTLLRGQLPAAELAALEGWVQTQCESPEARGRLLFALANVLDARGEFARAAELLREANALTHNLKHARRAYDPEDHARFTTAMIEAFSAAHFTRTRGFGLTTRLPIFVFGLPRSGTTLIEQILASHPDVHACGELRFSRNTLESLPRLINPRLAPIDCVPLLDQAATHAAATAQLAKMQALAPASARRITDKMPDNYMFLGMLATLYPNATFIHCRRDLRDVALSCWITDFRGMYWANDQFHIASRFHQYRRFMNHWRQVLPTPMLELDYEEIIQNPEPCFRRLVEFCGLGWDNACLEFFRKERSVRTASLTQVRQPIYSTSVGRHRNYQTELGDLFAMLEEEPADPHSIG